MRRTLRDRACGLSMRASFGNGDGDGQRMGSGSGSGSGPRITSTSTWEAWEGANRHLIPSHTRARLGPPRRCWAASERPPRLREGRSDPLCAVEGGLARVEGERDVTTGAVASVDQPVHEARGTARLVQRGQHLRRVG